MTARARILAVLQSANDQPIWRDEDGDDTRLALGLPAAALDAFEAEVRERCADEIDTKFRFVGPMPTLMLDRICAAIRAGQAKESP